MNLSMYIHIILNLGYRYVPLTFAVVYLWVMAKIVLGQKMFKNVQIQHSSQRIEIDLTFKCRHRKCEFTYYCCKLLTV